LALHFAFGTLPLGIWASGQAATLLLHSPAANVAAAEMQVLLTGVVPLSVRTRPPERLGQLTVTVA
jgi:hypothetical protein